MVFGELPPSLRLRSDPLTLFPQPSVDIEAKVEDDKNLAVGIFTPEDMVNDSDVQDILEEMAALMRLS